jgi:DNA-binding transcriptional MerR regulator
MLRVKDVCARTGLSRQAIHFYVQQGLVDPPQKTGKTMAYYTEAHVQRILLVRELQEERFLPLKAIRALFAGRGPELSVAQRRTLAELKSRLPAQTTSGPDGTVALAPVLRRARLARRDASELSRAGLIAIERGRLPADQVWILELWGEVRAAGFTRELGITADLLASFDAGIEQIFGEEKTMLVELMKRVSAPELATLVERALPLVHSFLVRMHEAKVRRLFATAEVTS